MIQKTASACIGALAVFWAPLANAAAPGNAEARVGFFRSCVLPVLATEMVPPRPFAQGVRDAASMFGYQPVDGGSDEWRIASASGRVLIKLEDATACRVTLSGEEGAEAFQGAVTSFNDPRKMCHSLISETSQARFSCALPSGATYQIDISRSDPLEGATFTAIATYQGKAK